MADNTKIEWADATLNYVNGCSIESKGCQNCYAMKQAHRFPVRQGLTVKTKGGMVWTGEVRDNPKALGQALAWRRGRKIFWNAHGDLFHPSVSDEWIDRQFAIFALTPQHTHMVLTKRSARMREYTAHPKVTGRIGELIVNGAMDMTLRGWADPDLDWPDPDAPARLAVWPLSNVWLGVSVEDQQRADERTPDLLATPAAVRFLSCEPLLGPVWLRESWFSDPLDDHAPAIDWVIAGGESGSNARPMHPDWARNLRDQCQAAGVPFFFKQWGEWAVDDDGSRCVTPDGTNLANLEPNGSNGDGAIRISKFGKKRAGRLLDGVSHNGVPAHG